MQTPRRSLTLVCTIAISLGSNSCGHLPGTQPAPAIVWVIAAAGVNQTAAIDELAPPPVQLAGRLLVIDSTSLRPIVPSPLSTGTSDSHEQFDFSRIAVVTTYQGARYHPESIRSLSDDSQVMGQAASAIANAVMTVGNGLFLDFQDAAPDDLPRIAAITRAIADSAHVRRVAPIGIVVPPGDTVAYPTAVLARTADFIVVRLYGEHRPGTAPGPTTSPEWIARELGLRAKEIGVKRLVAELALFGYRWDSNGRAETITFAQAQALVASESGSFRRDPPTGLLTARGRNGWTVWVPDGLSIASLVATVRKTGVNRFALSGVSGADPDVWVRLPAAIRR